MTLRTIPAVWLARALERRGISLAMASTALGLEEPALRDRLDALPLRFYFDLFEWAAETLDDSLFGASIANEANPGEFGLLGYLANNGATLRENLGFIERYHAIFSKEFSFRFSEAPKSTWCTYFEANLPGSRTQQDILFSLQIALRLIRAHIGQQWQPSQCFFSFPEPKDTRGYQAFFGPNVTFDHPQNMFEFDSALLDVPAHHADASLLKILLHQANQLLANVRGEHGVVEKLRLLMFESLGTEALDSKRAAERLNMSVRTLYRHLDKEKTCFKRLREEVLVKVAKEALCGTRLSISEIAAQLNYSETSAFDRLFKRLTGMSPRHYRQKTAIGGVRAS